MGSGDRAFKKGGGGGVSLQQGSYDLGSTPGGPCLDPPSKASADSNSSRPRTLRFLPNRTSLHGLRGGF